VVIRSARLEHLPLRRPGQGQIPVNDSCEGQAFWLLSSKYGALKIRRKERQPDQSTAV
jgi:hypothetical protein